MSLLGKLLAWLRSWFVREAPCLNPEPPVQPPLPPGLIGYRVLVYGADDSILHDYWFELRYFPDARERALRHAEHVRELFAGCDVYVMPLWHQVEDGTT